VISRLISKKDIKTFPDIHPTLVRTSFLCIFTTFVGVCLGFWTQPQNNLLPFSWLSRSHELKAKIMTLNVFIIPFLNVYTITPFITFFRMWCPCLFNRHHFMPRPRLKCLDHNLAYLLNLSPMGTSFSIAFQIQLGLPHFSIIRFPCYVCTLPINPLGIHLLQCPHDNDHHIGRHDT